MRGLFFKVFIIFWIAQSMIFVISTALIVRHHFDRPDVAVRCTLQRPAIRRGQSGQRLRVRRAATAFHDYCGQHRADHCARRLNTDKTSAIRPGILVPSQRPAHSSPHHGSPGGPAICLESSNFICRRKAICLSAQPPARRNRPITGITIYCTSRFRSCLSPLSSADSRPLCSCCSSRARSCSLEKLRANWPQAS